MIARRLMPYALLLNLALAGWVGWLVATRSGPPGQPPALSPGPPAQTPSPSSVIRAPASVITNSLREPFTWAKVESPDYPQYIANLRAIQCPEATIQDIIISEVAKDYARQKAARQEARTREFWKTERQQPGRLSGGASQAHELERERRALLLQLLGPEAERERKLISGLVDWRGRSLAYLPESKRELVIELQDKFDESEQVVSRQHREGPVNAAWASGLKDLRTQQRVELTRLLSPQELEEFDLRHSEVSQRLRTDLSGFSPTEQEFRGIFRLQKTMEDQLEAAHLAAGESGDQRRRIDAQQELEKSIRSLLGEQRYQEYTRGRDWEYKALVEVTREQGLPPTTANQVYDLKKAVEDQKRQFNRDPNLTPEARQAALRTLQAETERALSQTLGDQAYQAYKRRHSYWIRSLAP